MSRRTIALLTMVLLSACRDRMNRGWDWNRMRVQPRTVSYGANTALPGGADLQLPPPGTVSTGDDEPPVVSTPERGQERYRIFCAVCHGEQGDGNSLIARDMAPPLPPSFLNPAAAMWTDAIIDSTMLHGAGAMMGFGADIPAQDRRAIIAYIRQLQRAAPEPR